MYSIIRCDMIAMKREVAAYAGFPWSECQKAGISGFNKLATSHCT
ncbi:hypothetical protein AALB81_01310 [Lachnospiraceae bacterium 48-33]